MDRKKKKNPQISRPMFCVFIFLEAFVNCRIAIIRLETRIPSKEKALIGDREPSRAFGNIIAARKKRRTPERVSMKKNLKEY